jgi:SAM-dependent methyltransferase
MSSPNQAAYEAWNGESGHRWITDPDRRDRVMSGVADALLDAARLLPGEAVLDIGCGCGATTLAAARTVGPTGSVLGVDLSEPMLGVARQRLVEAELRNVTLLHVDAQTHDFDRRGGDIAISRFGTMFFDDSVAAFTNIASDLRPGGRLCIATWQPLIANDWLTIPGAALLGYGTLPEAAAPGPGMFAQSDPAAVTDVLTASGFTDVAIRAITVSLHLGDDPIEATAHIADTGVGRAVLATISAHDHPAALDAVRAALAEHLDADGVQLDGAILLTTATKA